MPEQLRSPPRPAPGGGLTVIEARAQPRFTRPHAAPHRARGCLTRLGTAAHGPTESPAPLRVGRAASREDLHKLQGSTVKSIYKI